MPEGSFPPHLPAVFIFKFVVEYIVSNNCSNRINAFTTRRGDNLVAYLNFVDESIDLPCCGVCQRFPFKLLAMKCCLVFAFDVSDFTPSDGDAFVQFLFAPKVSTLTRSYFPKFHGMRCLIARL